MEVLKDGFSAGGPWDDVVDRYEDEGTVRLYGVEIEVKALVGMFFQSDNGANSAAASALSAMVSIAGHSFYGDFTSINLHVLAW